MTPKTCPPCTRSDHERCTSPDACECEVCGSIVWSDPPRKGPRGVRWLPSRAVLAELRKRRKPAMVREWPSRSSAHAAAMAIRKGKVPELSPDEWEAVGGTTTGTKGGLWLTYKGK